jgi:hypothetical protein
MTPISLSSYQMPLQKENDLMRYQLWGLTRVGTASSRSILLIGLAFLVLPSAGCIVAAVGTAALAGAGAAGYAYVQAATPGDFPADMDKTWTAAQMALADLKMTIDTAQRDNDTATIETRTGTGEKVTITLDPRVKAVPADGEWTHVTVRVATFGNEEVSDRVLKQMAVRLGLPQHPAVAGQSQPRVAPVPVVNPAVTPTPSAR